MKCVVDFSGVTHRIRNKNMLTSIANPPKAFALNATFIPDENEDFSRLDADAIAEMEKDLVEQFHEALAKAGIRATVEVEI